MKMCLVIPVFNERQQLEESVRLLLEVAKQWGGMEESGKQKAESAKGLSGLEGVELEFVIADNGSTDGTAEIAERLGARIPCVRHEYLSENGRGRALRQAWANSDADIVAYMDVDLSTDLSFFPALIEPLARGEMDLAVGSRLLRPEWTRRGWKREFISRCYNQLLHAVFVKDEEDREMRVLNAKCAKTSPVGLSFSDAQCGFKAIMKKAADELLPLVEDNEWFFDTELLLLADYFGYRIHDLPVRWKDDSDSRVKIVPTIMKDLRGILRMRRRLRELARGVGMENLHRARRAQIEEVQHTSGRGG